VCYNLKVLGVLFMTCGGFRFLLLSWLYLKHLVLINYVISMNLDCLQQNSNLSVRQRAVCVLCAFFRTPCFLRGFLRGLCASR
jgi:hypothetical protein